MNEAAAREVVLVRAVEATDAERSLWSDDDRAWASRAAAEVVGGDAPVDAFVARRAALAVERLGTREPAIPRLLRAIRWRPWVGAIVVIGAFLLGLAANRIGDAQRVNILAFPLLGILAWNAFAYLLILVKGAVGLADVRARTLGPLARLVARAAARMPAAPSGPQSRAMAVFLNDWTRASEPLLAARVGFVLHLAAAALALGAVAGLYLRGLVLEYRAGWESTFLDAAAVHGLLAFVLGPASAITGIPIPDAAHLEGIRFGADRPGENAAPWIHLHAVTIAGAVILPRALLALGTWFALRGRVRRFPLRLDEPYFQRLARQVSRAAARVVVLPYAFQLAPQSVLALREILARLFGTGAEIVVAPSVAWGGEEDAKALPLGDADHALVAPLFNMTSTPEPENHGAFLAALVKRRPAGAPLVVLVDEAAFRARFGDQPARMEERRAGWRSLAEAHGVEVVFLDLSASDAAAAERALDAAIERMAAR